MNTINRPGDRVPPPSSPWGTPTSMTELAPGIVSCSTSSHGGIWLAPGLLALVPVDWRRARFNSPDLSSPWFEEDCDWSMVALTFPQAFRAPDIDMARRIFRTSFVATGKVTTLAAIREG